MSTAKPPANSPGNHPHPGADAGKTSLSYRCLRGAARLGSRLMPGPLKAKLRNLVNTHTFQSWAERNLHLYSGFLNNLNHDPQNLINLMGPQAANKVNVATVLSIARTGAGSDECLEAGCLPMLVHFYSPVPDLKDLAARDIWNRRSDLAGLDFRPGFQREFLLSLGREHGQECNWGPDPTDDPQEFYTENQSFSFGCAASTHLMIRRNKPRRIIEIGSGFSSRVISAAVLANERDTGQKAEYTIVDPYPGEVVTGGLPGVSELIAERVELMPPDFADGLGENDILFIDSGHCVRIGSDINFLILDILPRLAPGVTVHFHDIPMPAEYPKALFTNPSFRQFWTESYLLQAFLCHNDQFEVLLAMAWLMQNESDAFCEALPLYDPQVHKAGSGSFWIRRKPSAKPE